ncbi:hypothetical protein CDAR_17951 [Caerostris darwini]|uniref:Uncharacterized protein n=1 Tax=Caerostris darwini TaxID=1538125 RepID=A0AAV4UGE4_9ARAC|nr:hypothetical protein CDAR_17951 [Caerostris darwini]
MISYIYGNRPWTDICCLLCYIDIHHHHLPSQFGNSMDRAHTPALDRRLLALLQPQFTLIFTYHLLHFRLQSASSSFLLPPASSGGSLSRPFICLLR